MGKKGYLESNTQVAVSLMIKPTDLKPVLELGVYMRKGILSFTDSFSVSAQPFQVYVAVCLYYAFCERQK